MTWLLSFLWSNRNYVAVGLLALAVGGYISALKYQVHSRDNQIAKLSAEIATLNTEKASLQVTIDRLNMAMKVLTDEGKRKKANADMWRKKFDAEQLRNKGVIDDLTKWQPKTGESDCEAAKRIITDYRK